MTLVFMYGIHAGACMYHVLNVYQHNYDKADTFKCHKHIKTYDTFLYDINRNENLIHISFFQLSAQDFKTVYEER